MRKNSVSLIALAGIIPVLVLAGCTANETVSSGPAATTVVAAAPVAAYPVPGGSARWGGSIASMADQYNRPRAGKVAATGASAWVPPAPPPAFALTDLPPAGPAAPPPAAVANRQPAPQPAARPAVDAANIVRPEAAAAESASAAPAAALSAATRDAGRKLFSDYSCASCHALADAGASGSIGPSLDRNSRLSKDYIVDTLMTGRGAMPSFAGQMSDAEMATLAEYIVGVSRK